MSYCCCKYKLLEISRLLAHADMRIIELSRTFHRITWLLRNVYVLGFLIHYYRVTSAQPKCSTQLQSPVVQRPNSPNPGLNFNSGFFISLWQKSFREKFLLLILEHPMIKSQARRFKLNFLLKLSDLKSNFTLTLGYLNPALNNPGLISKNTTNVVTYNVLTNRIKIM